MSKVRRYWLNPSAEENSPSKYLKKKDWEIVVEMCNRHAKKDVTILELGSSVGLTLQRLEDAGYKSLYGIELNPESVALMIKEFGREIGVIAGAIEDHICDIQKVDVVVSKATLCHLPYTSDWVFEEIANRTHAILTVENERTQKTGGRHFPRHYGDVFWKFGFRQVEFVDKVPHMNEAYKARWMEKAL